MAYKQPWIESAIADTLLILSPPFLGIGLVFYFRRIFDSTDNVPLWFWVSVILCVDVAHVYSTLFRTYLSRTEFQQRRVLLRVVPVLCLGCGIGIYAIHAMLFWTILAYIAVFHFVRQQYGFMRLYSREEPLAHQRLSWIDACLIYIATGYPLIYWHTHLPRNFNWFIDGDFISGLPTFLEPLTLSCYVLIFTLYIYKECSLWLHRRVLNIPKQLIVSGTMLSWYVGIVIMNGDMAFTLTNVLSHGLPYMGLVWIVAKRRSANQSRLNPIFSIRMLPVFFGVLIACAYVEEGLWDGFIWRDHLWFFPAFAKLPSVESFRVLTWLVPLLTLPQLTHYVLDGFIWRLREQDTSWHGLIFQGKKRVL